MVFMRKKPLLSIPLLFCLMLGIISCGPSPSDEKGTVIISAREAMETAGTGGTVWVDAQTTVNYRKNHVDGAVNIPRTAITVSEPYPNMLAPAATIETVMRSAGINDDSLVIVYDDNKNMDAARLWWTLKIYGHDNIKVVSGGLHALAAAGAEINNASVKPDTGNFTAASIDSTMLADRKMIKDQIKNPSDSIIIIDTRSMDEYNEGTIPGSIPLDFTGNNFSDGTYKPDRHIRIRYLENGADYDDTIIMFCKTSIRGAQTYLALYNAGYTDLKLYDGAWVEWSANPANPIYTPEPDVYKLDSSDQS